MDHLQLEIDMLLMPAVCSRAIVMVENQVKADLRVGKPFPTTERKETMLVHTLIVTGADRSDLEWLVDARWMSAKSLVRFDSQLAEMTR